jgi:hypothetical protein
MKGMLGMAEPSDLMVKEGYTLTDLVVTEDGDDPVPWGGKVRKVKAAELARRVGHRKDHRVLLPLQPVSESFTIQFSEFSVC